MTALTAGEGGKNKQTKKTSTDERHRSVCAFTASADRLCLSPTAMMGGLLQVHQHERTGRSTVSLKQTSTKMLPPS